MRKMSIEQAKNYIKAGYFPKENEIEAICDLQDVFGNLPWHFVTEEILIDSELRENGEKLLRLIYAKDDVDRYIQKRDEYERMVARTEEMEVQLEQLIKNIESNKRKIKCYGYKNVGEED